MRKDKKDETLDESHPPKEERPDFSVRKLSILLFGLLLLSVVVCGTVLSVHFNDPEWFKYGVGSVFTALLLVVIFGWPF